MHKPLITLAIALAAAFGGSAWAADTMTKDAYKAAKEKVEQTAKADKQACSAMKANTKDICQVEAKAKEKIAKAELEAQYKPSAKADEKVRMTKAETTYDVAKEKCEDQKGKEMSACKQEAKATYGKAKAEAKVANKSSAATKS